MNSKLTELEHLQALLDLRTCATFAGKAINAEADVLANFNALHETRQVRIMFSHPKASVKKLVRLAIRYAENTL